MKVSTLQETMNVLLFIKFTF